MVLSNGLEATRRLAKEISESENVQKVATEIAPPIITAGVHAATGGNVIASKAANLVSSEVAKNHPKGFTEAVVSATILVAAQVLAPVVIVAAAGYAISEAIKNSNQDNE